MKGVEGVMNIVQLLSGRPLKLKSNRVWRTYTGGQMIEAWQGNSDPKDSTFPEEWVASRVKAFNMGREHLQEGLSELDLEEGASFNTLKEIVELDPIAFLGEGHIAVYKEQLGVLVKVLDASERLTIQVHPSRENARTFFDSDFGKTEAWLILGGREINGEPPSIYLGFKPGMTKARWKDLFERQAINEMLDALHRVTVQKGDVYLVEGGIPHAIGAGCFMIEIQEPTDLTLRTERITPSGLAISDTACHQNIGFERMLDCFKYNSMTLSETLKRYKKTPQLISMVNENLEYQLIGAEDTDCFSMNLIEVHHRYERQAEKGFVIAVVLQGQGELCWNNETLQIDQADQLFIPAGVKETQWQNRGQGALQVVLCYPPTSRKS
jgi:mannose-6-phosphate isomerase